MSIFFTPAKAGLNVTARFSVRVVPLIATELDAIDTEHWLFCSP
jgi:hypothetical protein